MNISEKAELFSLIHHFERFLKSGISIENTEVPEVPKRLSQKKKEKIAIAKLDALQANISTSVVRRFRTE